MSILKKPYELSVWEDVWVPEKTDAQNNIVPGHFQERRICIIGTDVMESQSRALEPTLTRNVNGQVKLTFKMYHRYIDTITGKEVINPFSDVLINERKVKLCYGTFVNSAGSEEPRWYDFVIKNIVQNSSNYLYTYQLEDALVNELSRNGYGVTLDDTLMNNLGTTTSLGNKVLEGSGWSVAEGSSEVIVEKVNEPLVYLTLNKNNISNKIYRINDQSSLTQGVTHTLVFEKNTRGQVVVDTLFKAPNNDSTDTITVLGCYSSCTSKPYRFQFIFSKDGYVSQGNPTLERDEERTILTKDCQYFCDIPQNYAETSTSGYYLPNGFSLLNNNPESSTSPISYLYRCDRYGYAQEGQFVPLLDRYVQKYLDATDPTKEYCGYITSEQISPLLLQNFATNSKAESTAGWTGATSQKQTPKAKIEMVYGRFASNSFVSAQSDLLEGTFDLNKSSYKSYIKCTLNHSKNLIINSGPFDHRTIIGNITPDDEWAFSYTLLDSTGNTPSVSSMLSGTISEINYNSTDECYSNVTGGLTFTKVQRTSGDTYSNGRLNGKYSVYKATNNPYTEKTFKKNMKVRLSWTYTENGASVNRDFSSTPIVFYITDLEFFKLVLGKDSTGANRFMIPVTCGGEAYTGELKKKYKFFSEEQLTDSSIKSIEDISHAAILDEMDYSKFVPKLNASAEKTRTINIKESNYFNNLQTIAENFETWLELRVTRESDKNSVNYGGILNKEVLFKNYAGKTNLASFKYGINLKDIQRTFESKGLVTKLFVKTNNNEFADNGFCTIQRANSNPTGETYIYDFQYYHNMDLLDERRFLEDVWASDGYYSKLKNANRALKPLNEEMALVKQEIVELNANKQLYDATKEAATSEIESLNNELESIIGTSAGNIHQLRQYKPRSAQDNSPTIDLYYANSTDSTYGCFQWSDYSEKDGIVIAPTSYTDYDSAKSWYESEKQRYKNLLEGKPNSVDLTRATWTDPENNTETGKKQTRIAIFRKKTETLASATIVRTQQTGASYPTLDAWNQADKTKLNPFKYYEIRVYGVTRWGYCSQNTGNPWTYTSTSSPPTSAVARTKDSTSYKTTEFKNVNTTVLNFFTKYSFSDGDYFFDGNFWKKDYVDKGLTISMTASPRVVLGTLNGPQLEQYPVTRNNDIKFEENVYRIEETFVISPVKELLERKDVSGLLQEYALFSEELLTATNNSITTDATLTEKENRLEELQDLVQVEIDKKDTANLAFFTKYSRFIQEGVWQDDKYTDDEKYYTDSLSVLYNSCYPKVAYTINVVALDALPEYRHYSFDIGDRTYAEDPLFFGDRYKEEVIVTEITDNLDDPSKKVIKVQNFKNQFQDLFQKITATVQQAEYRSGAYEKAVKVVEGEPVVKQQFLTDALNNAAAKLTAAGQQTVVWDSSGITVVEKDKPCNSIRMVGGAILLSKQNENGEQQWTTGLTSDGISASLITAGVLNAGEIKIMSGRDPAFRWDDLGITAFDRRDGLMNTKKFVRFDKNGVYGIDANQEGESYSPENLKQIDTDATFALTWDGLKVTGLDGAVLHIGRQGSNIFEISDGDGNSVFGVDGRGTVQITGNLSKDSTFDNNTLTAIIDQHIEDFNFHTIEYGTKIDKALDELDILKGDMTPLSMHPTGIIVEEGSGANSGDKSKIYCTTKEGATGLVVIDKVFYYNKVNGKYTTRKQSDNTTVANPEYWTADFATFKSSVADTSKIYYFKPIKTYYYYNSTSSEWVGTTNVDDINLPKVSYTGLVDKALDTEAILGTLVGYNNSADDGRSQALSGFIQKANDRNAELSGLVEYSSGKYVTIEDWSAITDKTSYATNGNIIYDLKTEKYFYYKDSKWNETTDLSTIPNYSHTAAGMFARASENMALAQLLVQNSKSALDRTIAGVTASATADRAAAEMLASYITGGKYQALDENVVWSEEGKSRDTVYLAKTTTTSGGTVTTISTYYYYNTSEQRWIGTTDPNDAGLQITTAGLLVEAINNKSSASLKADMIGFDTSAFTVKNGNDILMQAGKVGDSVVVNLAGWSVKHYGFLGPVQEYTLNGVTHKKPTIGFAPVPSHACWAIWAGQQTGDGTGEGNKAYGHDAPFHVGHDGHLYATNATISGSITATGGNIAGWTIADGGDVSEKPILFNRITHKADGTELPLTERFTTGMAALPNPDHVAFWAGCPMGLTPWEYNAKHNEDPTNYPTEYSAVTPFYITSKGAVVANNITITGGSLNINNKFKVDPNGNVRLDGNITWGANSAPTKAVYARTQLTKPANNTTSFDASSSTTWHTTFDSSNDKFASYSHDGGATWTETVRIVGENGTNGKDGTNGTNGRDGIDGKDGSDATVNYTNVFNALTNYGTSKGCFTASGNDLYINADYIQSGALNIGGTAEKNYTDAKFYANIASKTVYLSGFEFTNNKLINTVWRHLTNQEDGDGYTVELDASSGTLKCAYGTTWGVGRSVEYGVGIDFYRFPYNSTIIRIYPSEGTRDCYHLYCEGNYDDTEGYVKWKKVES